MQLERRLLHSHQVGVRHDFTWREIARVGIDFANLARANDLPFDVTRGDLGPFGHVARFDPLTGQRVGVANGEEFKAGALRCSGVAVDAVSAPILTLASISLLPHVKRRCCSIFPEAAFRIGIDTSAVVGPLDESLTLGGPATV